ncbi:MAG TPA: DoxX family protein [Blastocatellia bacterium]|nr:DoxX family protein [Blastocatellia bacterium]
MEFFEKRKDYGAVFIRIIIGVFIIYGVQDNVFSREHMNEFAAFLSARSVPYPLAAAHLSAYAQMICGISILLGAFVRWTAVPFIINFIAAIIIAHLGDTFRGMFPALAMIFIGFFFLFNGAGKLSVDDRLERRRERAGQMN